VPVKKSFHSLHVLRGGFAVILILLATSAWEALQLQSAGDSAQQAAYHRYIEREDAVAALRRVVWQGGISSRDYFISPDAVGQRQLSRSVDELAAQGQQAVGRLLELDRDLVASLRLEEVFQVWLDEVRKAPGKPKSYIAEVLVPRRLAVFTLIEEFRNKRRKELTEAQDRYQAERLAASRLLVILLAASLTVGVGVTFFTLRIAGRNERERQTHSQELEHLSARLLEVQEEERRSLSRELHDEVGQSLTALRMEISHAMSLLAGGEARTRLRRARELAERTVRMVRDISLLLRPSLLDDLGLGAALQWQLEDFGRRSGIRTEFTGADVGEDLSDEAKTCVFRIAQETLHNCEKYSRASLVRVLLGQEGSQLQLEVVDDGVGISLSERGLPRQGTGIVGIKERAQKLGGSVVVESRPGAGTRILVRIPVETARRAEVYS
jgi:signal transduction histidine kinase